jgi:hypothetical protein
MISKRVIVIVALLACLLSDSAWCANSPSEEEINNVLTSAEVLFKAMKSKQYPDIWQGLTAKTKTSILDAVLKESKKAGTEMAREKIASDFEGGGAIAQAYWNAYLIVFNPEMVLEQSKWTIGAAEKDRVEINILYKKSNKPAVLQLFRENEKWKVGLNETFGTRSMILF